MAVSTHCAATRLARDSFFRNSCQSMSGFSRRRSIDCRADMGVPNGRLKTRRTRHFQRRHRVSIGCRSGPVSRRGLQRHAEDSPSRRSTDPRPSCGRELSGRHFADQLPPPPMMSPGNIEQPGITIGRYKLIHEIGRAGWALSTWRHKASPSNATWR